MNIQDAHAITRPLGYDNLLHEKELYRVCESQAEADLDREYKSEYKGGDVLAAFQDHGANDPDYDEEIASHMRQLWSLENRKASDDEMNAVLLKLGKVVQDWLIYAKNEYVESETENRALEYMSKKVR